MESVFSSFIDLLTATLGTVLFSIAGLVASVLDWLSIAQLLRDNEVLRFSVLSLSKSTVFVVVCVFSLGVPACVYFERKIAAYMQDRLGPNRVGPFGILQPIADALKFFFKEDVVPGHVDKILYCLAPALALIPVFLSFAAVPFGPGMALTHGYISPAAPAGATGADTLMTVPMVLADLDLGLLYIFAISSLAVYGVSLGGWASNSKYSIFGAVRGAAQMVSYEITLGMSVVGIFLFCQTLSLTEIVTQQVDGYWFLFTQPMAFLIFLVSYFAETNRLPFDLPECETELVAGYHIEYSSMKFAMFFMAEYAAMVIASALVAVLFLGGYDLPGVNLHGLFLEAVGKGLAGKATMIGLVGFGVFVFKIAMLLLFFMLIRWTLPRFRYDQLMHLGWKFFMPLGMLNIVLCACLKLTVYPWLLAEESMAWAGFYILIIWVLNLVIWWLASVLAKLGGSRDG